MNIAKKALFGLAAAAGIAAGPALAEVDFTGKRIEIIISSREGGGADTYARFMGESIKKYLPGNPTVVYRNLTGGGGLISANWFEQNAEPDGLTVYSSAGSSKLAKFFVDPELIEYDLMDWVPIVSSPNGYNTNGSAVAGTMTLEDIMAKGDEPLSIGLASVSGSSTVQLLSFWMLGVNIQPAFNVPGGDAQLSFERGEFQLNGDSMGSFFRLNGKNWEEGKVAPIFSYGQRTADGSIGRDPIMPTIPSFPEAYEMVHGKPPSGPAWDAWEGLFDLVVTNSKTFVLPQGTPDDIVEAWREAARKAVNDPEINQSEAWANILGKDVPQFIGDDATKSLVASYDKLSIGIEV